MTRNKKLMAGDSRKGGRASLALLFAALLAVGSHYIGVDLQAANEAEIQHFQQVLNFTRHLTGSIDGLFDEAEQRQLQDSALRLQLSLAYWTQYADSGGHLASQARKDCAVAASNVFLLLDGSTQVDRLWVGSGASRVAMARRWPLGSGVVLLRIGRSDAPGASSRTVRGQYDLSQISEAVLDIGGAETTYAALSFSNAPTGERRVLPIRLRAGGVEIATAELAVTTPPTGTLRVRILDVGTGKPTAAAAGVFASNDEIITPTDALAFDKAGFFYDQAGRVRPRAQVHYWPGHGKRQRSFFVNGEFTVRVPEGNYQVIASKGPEYLPVNVPLAVKASGETVKNITLRRWTNMPARGWYSGDAHVHYARLDAEANRQLIIWMQAEDIHVANALRMGDFKETYYEQYGFGKEGRYAMGGYAVVPGQEDPRTNVIGHTIQLNLQHPIRFPERYYLYDLVFDETHSQGGLTGYAHIYAPAGSPVYVRRDMALNMPIGRIDFAEIGEFGDVYLRRDGDNLYYEYLNMGFPLTAMAGSDVPFGNTLGSSRVYAYTGERFSPDAWFAAVKAGHTFVTNGPMLEFSVNGKIAGSEIEANPGDVLHIRAAASGEVVAPRYLEIVSQGEVVKSTKSSSLEFDLPVRDSTWIAARCYGAHTTPVYVKVNGHRFWKREQLGALVARRMDDLKELEEQTKLDVAVTPQNGDNPSVWRQSAAALHDRIKVARQTYEQMLNSR